MSLIRLLTFFYQFALEIVLFSSSFLTQFQTISKNGYGFGKESFDSERRLPPKYIENTFQAIQSTFRYLEMYSKRRYKIFICSVVLGQLESFRNYKGFGIIFPTILGAILSFTKMRRFLILLFVAFPFSTKNSLTWGLKCEIKLQKIVGNLLDVLRKLYINGTVIQKFLAFLKLQKMLGNFSSPNRYFTETTRWVPLQQIHCNFTRTYSMFHYCYQPIESTCHKVI